jgi:hypothetical protein
VSSGSCGVQFRLSPFLNELPRRDDARSLELMNDFISSTFCEIPGWSIGVEGHSPFMPHASTGVPTRHPTN